MILKHFGKIEVIPIKYKDKMSGFIKIGEKKESNLMVAFREKSQTP